LAGATFAGPFYPARAARMGRTSCGSPTRNRRARSACTSLPLVETPINEGAKGRRWLRGTLSCVLRRVDQSHGTRSPDAAPTPSNHGLSQDVRRATSRRSTRVLRRGADHNTPAPPRSALRARGSGLLSEALTWSISERRGGRCAAGTGGGRKSRDTNGQPGTAPPKASPRGRNGGGCRDRHITEVHSWTNRPDLVAAGGQKVSAPTHPRLTSEPDCGKLDPVPSTCAGARVRRFTTWEAQGNVE